MTSRHTMEPKVLFGTLLFFSVAAALGTPSCGGGTGGEGPGSAGGLTLLAFQQASEDNVCLNRALTFLFTDAVDPSSIGPTSLQIREGSEYGRTVAGAFQVEGPRVLFTPRLPSLCDISDAGLRPATTYHVMVVGYPEEFSIRAVGGDPLDSTRAFTFTTLPESDPALFSDEVPGAPPSVLGVTPGPVPGDPAANAAVSVRPSDAIPARVVVRLSENVDPCTVNGATVLFHQYERGDPDVAHSVAAPNGNLSGFDPVIDADPDPTRWGASNATVEPTPRAVPAVVRLVQSPGDTRIEIDPLFGEYPDDALLVVELTSGIEDFAHEPLVPLRASFTTENLAPRTSCRTLEFDGDVEIDVGATNAEVNTARAPSRAQGFLLFSGDGDDGENVLLPAGPATPASGCVTERQVNDGIKDDFDPASDVMLDTGSVNTCANEVDGSRGVVWEFQSFRIRSGVTVRIVGVNPAILLVQGDVTIEAGGRLLARGDGVGGAPQGRGANGYSTTNNAAAGGTAVAGGGGGGTSPSVSGSYPARYGDPGQQGYHHDDDGSLSADVGQRPGTGGGHGNSSVRWNTQAPNPNLNSPAGGGGGHATAGVAGMSLGSGTSPTSMDLTPDGAPGSAYGGANGRMLLAEAGSGGGAAGEIRPFSGNAGRGTGGAGGAGGGFIDLTAAGKIRILGVIDAAGSPGGNGATQPFNPNYTWQPGSGGGGGGSGGGLRLLTPTDIELASTTSITVAGGNGGVGGDSQGGGPPRNSGGAGANGRLVLEDGDSLVSGIAGAALVPDEGNAGFYRGVFDATRFQGVTPKAVTLPFFAGPWNPTYTAPVAADFVAGVPLSASRGVGSTAILVEAIGYPLLDDGSPDLTAPSGWYTIGHFRDSGVIGAPAWVVAQPGDVSVPSDNVGVGLANLNGLPWLAVRFTFFLPSGLSTQDPGPYVDRWSICFQYDQ